ncbi:MAG: peptidylprolyl isomerase [Planctomycetes bacterium]|nr:peptidylprolyl isomerase [Planctomycetota bacterium]
MQGTWKVVVACAVLGLFLGTVGCGSGGQEGEGGDNAAANTQGEGDSGTDASLATATKTTPAEPAAPVRPVVLIETDMGSITVELDHEKAPRTVENFLEYVDSQFYDQTVFHQVFPGAVVLGGMLTAELAPKETNPAIDNEATNGLKNRRGTIAMFRDPGIINSATSQFFINAKDNPNYDHQPGARDTLNSEDYGYCVFGQVTDESLSVVDQIANVEVKDTAELERTPVRTVMIKTIRKVR